MTRVRIFNQFDLKRMLRAEPKKYRLKVLDDLTTAEFNSGIVGAFDLFNQEEGYNPRITDKVLGPITANYVVDGKMIQIALEDEYRPIMIPGYGEPAPKKICFSRDAEYWEEVDALYGTFLDYAQTHLPEIKHAVLETRREQVRNALNEKIWRKAGKVAGVYRD